LKLLRKRRRLKQRLLNGRNLLKSKRLSQRPRLLLQRLLLRRDKPSLKKLERKIKLSMKLHLRNKLRHLDSQVWLLKKLMLLPKLLEEHEKRSK